MNRKDFFSALRSRSNTLFGTSLSAKQVKGIDGILDAFDRNGDGRSKTLAYALASAYHETGKAMVPIKETVMPYHKNKNPTDAQVINRLDRWAKKIGRTTNIYWRVNPRTGKAYFGRGHIQITWLDNYERSSADAGVDLVKNPDAMLDSEISARVMIRGLLDGRWNGRGKGIAFYLPTNGEDDLKNARRTVNVTDRWQDVAGYYHMFLMAIEGAGGVSAYDPESIVREDAAFPDEVEILPPRPKAAVAGGIIAALLAGVYAFACKIPFLSNFITACGG